MNTQTERGEGPPGPPEEDLVEMKESTSWRKLGRRDLVWTSAIFASQKNLEAVSCCSGFSFFPPRGCEISRFMENTGPYSGFQVSKKFVII